MVLKIHKRRLTITNIDTAKPDLRSSFTVDCRNLIVMLPYTKFNTPDPVAIMKSVQCYADIDWMLVGRTESELSHEFGGYTLLQFMRVL